MDSRPDIADIAIIGSGLSGITAALALAGPATRTPFRVILCGTGEQGPADGRASAITESSRRMLDVLGAWKDLEPFAEPMREIVVTDSRLGERQRPALLHFDPTRADAPSAYMIENRDLLRVLEAHLAALGSVQRHASGPVSGIVASRGVANVSTSGGQALSARLLVGADGRTSTCRTLARIESFGWAYPQSAIVVTVEHERPHGGRAVEHFLPAGPFAILPLTGNRSSIVWTETSAEAERLVGLSGPAFAGELARRFGEELGAIRPLSQAVSHPLAMSLSRTFIGERLALIGDAAHVVHPIAGLGFNLGLRDIAALAEVVTEDARLGLDFAGEATLKRYEAMRRLDTVMTAIATDWLNRLFSNDAGFARLLRDMGLAITDRLDPLKGLITKEAAGLTGSLPKLMQGQKL